MRHQVRGRKLGRTSSHRLATMRALSTALIKNRRIETTLAKAKELRRYVEPLITRARKEDNSHNRRQIFSFLNDKDAVTMLYDEIIEAVGDREGGYTRVIKTGIRKGDGAPTAIIELVDFNDVKPEGKEKKKRRTRRGGGGGGAKKSAAADKKAEAPAKEKAPAKEAAAEEKKEAKAKADEAKAEAEAAPKEEAGDSDKDKS